MASGVHPPTYPQLPPNFSQHGHSTSMNGSFSQPQLQSFDGSRSIASTPAPTPPPHRPGSQQQMAYGMNGGPVTNGMMPRTSFGGYQDPNMYTQPGFYNSNNNGVEPQIYTAVYSNVSVYEMEVKGVAVMRRRSDGWLNATQILKVAGVEKGKRTKVLEKEILQGEHEKVQGGYGKYQGTWISYGRGVEFCRQYGVEGLLRPLLEYDLSQDGTNGIQGMETPTKEQAMAAQRKRMYGNTDGRQMSQSGGTTFFKGMSSTAASAVNALNRTRVDSPNRGMDGRRSVGARRPSQQHQSQDNMLLGGSQQSMYSVGSQDILNGSSLSQGTNFADFPNTDSQEPPRKRIRPSPQTSFGPYDGNMDISMQEGSPTEPNHSFFSQHNPSFMDQGDAFFGLEPLPPPRGQLEEQKKEHLLDLFIDPSRTDFDDHPAFLTLSGDEFELPIDASCNTALHWAATLARIPLVRKLLEKGFNLRRTNSGGETALVAACQARNNLDQGSFPELLELLGSSIEIRDGRARTLLHHVAVSSAMRGRAAVGRYYLESLLEFVVRQGSVSNSQEMSFGGMDSANSRQSQPMTLARFMTDVVNAQDKSGDTALNLAARTSTKSIIDQLIEVGADPHISNRGGLAPVDFGVGNDTQTQSQTQHISMLDAPAAANPSQQSFAEAQSGILTSIRDILTASELDFAAELQEKQEALDKTNAALKESGTALAEERRNLEDMQARVREREELEQKIKNLQRSNSELRAQLGQPQDHTQSQNQNQQKSPAISVGEADRGLDFDGRLNALNRLFPIDDPNFNLSNPPILFTQEQSSFLSSLERDSVLRGRLTAYTAHNSTLQSQAKVLKARSTELEERYRKIVSLCTGAEEARVDELLDNLVQAVVSEQKEDVELGRVRDFLRMVKGGE